MAPFKFRELEVLYEESWVVDLDCRDLRWLRRDHVACRYFHPGTRAGGTDASHARTGKPAAAGCRCTSGFAVNRLQGTNQIGAGGFDCHRQKGKLHSRPHAKKLSRMGRQQGTGSKKFQL